jgi:biopolymer transport protein ExbB
MNTQFGLANLWSQGDIVMKSTAILLLIMSLASWVVIALKTLDLLRYKKVASRAEAF